MRGRWWLKLMWWGYLTYMLSRFFIWTPIQEGISFMTWASVFGLFIFAVYWWIILSKELLVEWYLLRKAKFEMELNNENA